MTGAETRVSVSVRTLAFRLISLIESPSRNRKRRILPSTFMVIILKKSAQKTSG